MRKTRGSVMVKGKKVRAAVAAKPAPPKPKKQAKAKTAQTSTSAASEKVPAGRPRKKPARRARDERRLEAMAR